MISTPEDYGFSSDQTLAHRCASSPPEQFEAFWETFRDEVASLSTAWRGRVTVSAPVGEVIIPSLRGVHVVARVTLGEDPSAGVVVVLHGSSTPDAFEDRPEPWSELGLTTLRLRVRGYPPSTMDIDDLRPGWISHRLGSPDGWIVRGAVGDVVQAVRCAGRFFGGEVPISLSGESLGGGLAVMAAAQLSRLEMPPQRLAIGLPSLGDWAWRRGRYCRGFGEQVNAQLLGLREEGDRLLETLLLFDAALHAPVVTCPTLCKLAILDDVVPAPAAAAVYNGVGAAWKRRWVVRYGHFEGGIADLRRHARYERLHPSFADPRLKPEEVVDEWSGEMELENA